MTQRFYILLTQQHQIIIKGLNRIKRMHTVRMCEGLFNYHGGF